MILRLALVIALGVHGHATAAEAQVAVAANFAAPAKQLAERFGRSSGHRVTLSSGSTGKFYAQIKSGAPFDALLSADEDTPRRLESDKFAVAGSRFAYAIGRLVLWSPTAGVVDANGEVLRRGEFKRLAIANPRLAPYGAAAQQAMQTLGVWARLQDRLVQGENIAQTYQFVASGNAELGFVAWSQVAHDGAPRGSYWPVPTALHAPLRQDAALLAHGADNVAAREFLAFLRSAEAREVIHRFGYDLP
jgi:molybdate transport system substrate-binding protein